MPRFLVYSHDDAQLFELDPAQVVSASSTEEINGEHSLTISTMQVLEKEQRILVQDGTLKWREYVITGVDAEHTDGAPVHTYYCVWSLQHDLMATKVNKQPGIRNPVSARVALTSALDGTDRWTVGTVTRNTTGGVSMYYMSGWEALSKVVEVWGGEVDVTIGVTNSGVVSRRVDLYDKQGSAEAVRRFDYGSDIESIKRTVSDEPFVCRIIPRGKGEETEGGGYGRRITIASVNGGIEWLEDSEAVPLVRLPDGQGGWEYPTLIVVNENIDDPQALKDWALEHIHDYTRPKVTYSASVVQFAEAGMDTQGIELGDTVQCVDRSFTEDGLRITGRVVRLVTNELDRRDIEVEVGFLKGTIASQFQSLQSSVETVSAYLETLANDMSTPEWIDGLIDRINNEVNATGGYTYIVEGNGIRTYDKAITDPAVGAEADAVVEIKGGTIRIANSRDGQGNWEWKTVFTSGHIAGDLVTAAQITTGYIGSAGGTFIDLDNNTVHLGKSSGGFSVDIDNNSIDFNNASGETRVTIGTAPSGQQGIIMDDHTYLYSGDGETGHFTCLALEATGGSGASNWISLDWKGTGRPYYAGVEIDANDRDGAAVRLQANKGDGFVEVFVVGVDANGVKKIDAYTPICSVGIGSLSFIEGRSWPAASQNLYLGAETDVYIETNDSGAAAARNRFSFTAAGNLAIPQAGGVYLNSSNLTNDSTPQSDTAGDAELVLRDSGNERQGSVSAFTSASGNEYVMLSKRRTVNGTNKYNVLRIGLDASGSSVVNVGGDNAQKAWRDGILACGVLAKRKTSVTLPANTRSVSCTAPTVDGYTFMYWLAPSTSGFVQSCYMSDPTAATTNCYLVGDLRSSDSTINIHAVYAKTS